jgi:hypothetical protein
LVVVVQVVLELLQDVQVDQVLEVLIQEQVVLVLQVKVTLVGTPLEIVHSPYFLLVVVVLVQRVTQAQARLLELVDRVRHRQLRVLL